MQIHIHIHNHNENEKIIHKLNLIQMTNAELLQLLTDDNTKLEKIITEIQALKDSVNTNPAVPQEIVDQVNKLGTNLQTADDLNPDA
jgi:chromosome segregation ATPase